MNLFIYFQNMEHLVEMNVLLLFYVISMLKYVLSR